MPAAGTDGPPTPTAGALGALGGNGDETVPAGGGPGVGEPPPNPEAVGDTVGAPPPGGDGLRSGETLPNAEGAGGITGSMRPGDGSGGDEAPPNAEASGETVGGEVKSSAVIGRGRGGVSRVTPWSRSQVWASPPMVSSSTRCVASIMFDIAVLPALAASVFARSMTAFTAVTLASIGSLPARIWLIC